MMVRQWMWSILISAVFDTVSHSILAAKLRKCGLDDQVVRWIVNWLKGRSQRVVVNGTSPGSLRGLQRSCIGLGLCC